MSTAKNKSDRTSTSSQTPFAARVPSQHILLNASMSAPTHQEAEDRAASWQFADQGDGNDAGQQQPQGLNQALLPMRHLGEGYSVQQGGGLQHHLHSQKICVRACFNLTRNPFGGEREGGSFSPHAVTDIMTGSLQGPEWMWLI